jgi:hypothetical protein
MSDLTTAVCLDRVQPGREQDFAALLERHWPTLHALGLVTEARPLHFQGSERDGGPLFVEIFTWASATAAGRAHEHPEVTAVWERVERHTEARAGRPNMEFSHVRPMQVR